MKYIDLNKTKVEKIKLNKPGDYVIHFKNFSGKLEVMILDKNISVNIYGLYIGRGNKSYKLDTIQLHKAGGSKSNLLIKGVFYDKSKLEYSGLIKIEKGAQKSEAYLRNDNLLMSKDSSVISKPYLEIEADEVTCNHAVTTGMINKESLYYMRSRGINSSEAVKIIVRGFLDEVFI